MTLEFDTPVPLVEFSHVSFAYANGTRALADVSFSFGAGSAYALVGPNGAGKSTCFRLLLGLDHPSAGAVRFDGQLLDASFFADRTQAKRLRQRIGLVFQDPDVQLFCPSVYDELAFALRQMGLSEAEVNARVADLLALFGLTPLAQRAPWQLSGGEKRRVAIAATAAANPELLCLDEPTNDLDDASVQTVVSFLNAFTAAGKTVLVSTHDHELVEALHAEHIHLGPHANEPHEHHHRS